MWLPLVQDSWHSPTAIFVILDTESGLGLSDNERNPVTSSAVKIIHCCTQSFTVNENGSVRFCSLWEIFELHTFTGCNFFVYSFTLPQVFHTVFRPVFWHPDRVAHQQACFFLLFILWKWSWAYGCMFHSRARVCLPYPSACRVVHAHFPCSCTPWNNLCVEKKSYFYDFLVQSFPSIFLYSPIFSTGVFSDCLKTVWYFWHSCCDFCW